MTRLGWTLISDFDSPGGAMKPNHLLDIHAPPVA